MTEEGTTAMNDKLAALMDVAMLQTKRILEALAKDKEMMGYVADICQNLHNELASRGFSEEQAMAIIVAYIPNTNGGRR